MAEQRDYYEVLGLSRNATKDDIRRAYRKLARQYHPDVNKNPRAVDRFAEVQEAYETLSDPQKRRAYDQFGHAGIGARAGPGGPRPGPWPPGGGRPGVDPNDMGSFFEELFAQRGGSPFSPHAPGRGAQPPPRPRRGQDMKHTITVSFMTAARGGKETVRLTEPDGAVRAIEVTIPPGVEPGAKLRVRGKGQPSPTGDSGGSSGDLILTIQIGAHPYYRREGLNLLVDVPINIAEAALGVTVTVPLLSSGSVELRIPSGASSGRKLRVPKQGITNAKGTTGDLLAVVQIVGPESLSEGAREHLEHLRGELQNPRKGRPWADLGN